VRGVSEPGTEPGTEPTEVADDPGVADEVGVADCRRAAVETGGMESDPVSDTPPYASRRDVVTGGMESDPIDEPGRCGPS
jgi:hypothetical protein